MTFTGCISVELLNIDCKASYMQKKKSNVYPNLNLNLFQIEIYMLQYYFLLFLLLSEVVSADPVYKPVPKPRRKALDEPIQSDNTHTDAVSEVCQTVERHRSPSDGTGSRSSPTDSGERSPEDTLSDGPPAVSSHSRSQRDGGDGNRNSKLTPVGSSPLVPQW